MPDRTRSDPSVREVPAAGFQVWEAPDRNLRIYLSTDVLERLRTEACDALKGVPRRGAEIGGILLGRTEPGGGRIVVIESLIPVPCEYRNGPHYSLSANDKIWFEAVLMKYRGQAGSQQSVAGYYRSHLRESLFLSAEDLMLIRAHFSDPANVFLVARPSASGACAVAVFFWEDGIVRSDSKFMELAAPGGTPGSGAFFETAPPAGGRRKFRFGTAAAGALAVAAAGAAFTVFRTQQPQPAPPVVERVIEPEVPANTPFSLRVESRSGSLLLTWNRSAPQVRSARMALLSIRDANYQKVVDLDMQQLQTGSIFYTPASGDVEFRLEVYADDNSRSVEAVRVLSARSDSISPRRNTVLPAPAAAPAVIAPADRVAVPAPPDTVPAQYAAPQRETVAFVPPRKFSPPVPARRPEPKLVLAESPPPLAAAAATHLPPVNPTVTLSPPPPAAPAPKPAPAPPPARPAQQPAIKYTAPLVIQQVAPTLASNIRALIVRDVEVRIMVDIDASGKVVKATALPNTNALAAYLAQSAIIAARAWKFMPATEAGRNVPSQMVLSFRFPRQRS